MNKASPQQIARDFLNALQSRDLSKAQSLLAPNAIMIFPGGVQFTELDELINWSKPRYQKVGKHIERIDECRADEGGTVTCQGTLYGVWNDGTLFEGIRFVDWFLIENGLIKRQHVWNDMAETQNLPKRR